MRRHQETPGAGPLSDAEFDAALRTATRSGASPERLEHIRAQVEAVLNAAPSAPPPLWRRLLSGRWTHLGAGTLLVMTTAALMTRSWSAARAPHAPAPVESVAATVVPAQARASSDPPVRPTGVPASAASAPPPAVAPPAPPNEPRHPRQSIDRQRPAAGGTTAAALVLDAVEHLRRKDFVQSGRLAARYIRENPEGVATELAYRVAIEAAAGNGETQRARELSEWFHTQYDDPSASETIDTLLDRLKKVGPQ